MQLRAETFALAVDKTAVGKRKKKENSKNVKNLTQLCFSHSVKMSHCYIAMTALASYFKHYFGPNYMNTSICILLHRRNRRWQAWRAPLQQPAHVTAPPSLPVAARKWWGGVGKHACCCGEQAARHHSSR